MGKSVIIVGAGISGLTSGFYAQLNGFQSKIFEMHSIPGGLCTAWKRKGYKFDISMHMVTASKSGPMHKMWEELGIAGKFRFHYHNVAMHLEGMGKKLTFTTDKEKLKNDMLAISPDDSKRIKEFIDLIFGPDIMNASSVKPAEMQTVLDKIKVLPHILPVIPTFMKYKSDSVQEFAAKFEDPFLQKAVRFFIDAPGWPMPKFPMAVLSGFIKSGMTEAGTPIGGSQQVVFHIADRYKKMGGEIHFNQRVKELIIENDKVVGILLEDNTEERADHVIWAGDGHTLIFDILKGKYINDRITKMYKEWIPVKPEIHVMLGISRDMTEEPHRIIFQPEEPITIAGEEHPWMTVIHHCFDETMAPKGKSSVEVWFETVFDFWDKLAKDRPAYEKEKNRIANYAISQLEKRWPGISKDVEVVDVATPYTYIRYTGNWKGSPDGWYITTDNMRVMQPLRKLPGLEGLHMVGQWTSPFTGTIIAALTGRQIIQLMCKNDGRKFKSQPATN